jgi:membrane associated rhomboid family serine protease
MFVDVEERSRGTLRWATPLLLTLIAFAYLWLANIGGPRFIRIVATWGLVPVRLFDLSGGWLEYLADLRPLALFSAMLIHADLLHVVGNLLFLLIFGLAAERRLGSGLFLALFLTGGGLANLATALSMPDRVGAIIGCSGAVSAIVGAYLTLFPRSQLGLVIPLGAFLEFMRIPALWLIGFWILLQVLMAYLNPTLGAIAWIAHAVGFIVGVLFAMACRPAVYRRMRRLRGL